MEKGNGKSGKKLKKHNSPGFNSGDIANPIDPIDDMETVRNQLQRMPEDGKVILFALFQLALASVRSQEAFGVFCDESPGLNAAGLSSL